MLDVVRIITSKQQIYQSDPVLIRQFSKELQSDPVLIRPKLASLLIQSDPALIRAHLWQAAIKGGLECCALGPAAQQSRPAGCYKVRAGRLHNRAGSRAAHQGSPGGCRTGRAAYKYVPVGCRKGQVVRYLGGLR